MIENLRCPNCGGPLDTTKADGNIIVCPYCGNKLLLSGLLGEKPEKNDEEGEEDDDYELQYYRPQLSVEQFESMCQNLFDNDPLLPDDIFHEVNFKEVKGIFLPTWTFRGKSTGRVSWTANDKYEYRTVDEYFEFRTAANRTSSGYLPEDMQQKLKAFDLNFQTDAETMWWKEFCTEYIQSINFDVDDTLGNLNNQRRLFREGMDQLYILGANIDSGAKNVNCNVKYKFDEEFDEVEDIEYVPFYIVQFNYKGQDYHMMCDAVNGSWFAYHLPEDSQRKKKLEAPDFPVWAIMSLSAIYLVPPLLWIFGPMKFTTLLLLAIPALIVSGIICFVAMEQTKAKKKEIIESAMKARKQ